MPARIRKIFQRYRKLGQGQCWLPTCKLLKANPEYRARKRWDREHRR